MDRLLWDLETAHLEGSDADFSNLIDAGLREPQRFARALAERAADERVRLLLSVQRALVGATSPSLYGVCAAVRDAAIMLTFYVAAEMTDEEHEDLAGVGTEVIADFTDNFTIDETFHTVNDAREPLPTVGDWVYLQRGFQAI
jgi:hypothetical protein